MTKMGKKTGRYFEKGRKEEKKKIEEKKKLIEKEEKKYRGKRKTGKRGN